MQIIILTLWVVMKIQTADIIALEQFMVYTVFSIYVSYYFSNILFILK